MAMFCAVLKPHDPATLATCNLNKLGPKRRAAIHRGVSGSHAVVWHEKQDPCLHGDYTAQSEMLWSVGRRQKCCQQSSTEPGRTRVAPRKQKPWAVGTQAIRSSEAGVRMLDKEKAAKMRTLELKHGQLPNTARTCCSRLPWPRGREPGPPTLSIT